MTQANENMTTARQLFKGKNPDIFNYLLTI